MVEGIRSWRASSRLGRAGFLGTGLAAGWPIRIPAVETDFILPLITEELGAAGRFRTPVASRRHLCPVRSAPAFDSSSG